MLYQDAVVNLLAHRQVAALPPAVVSVGDVACIPVMITGMRSCRGFRCGPWMSSL